MKTKIEIKSISGELLFSFEKENNSIKYTLEEAVNQGANLRGAYLRGANLRGAKSSHTTAMFLPQCPDEGSFIGWKEAKGKIVKLLITEDAKRSSSTTLKCRCSKAKVLDIQNIDGSKAGINAISSSRDAGFIYKIGEISEVKDFDDNRWNECSTGIHFFISRQAAVDWANSI